MASLIFERTHCLARMSGQASGGATKYALTRRSLECFKTPPQPRRQLAKLLAIETEALTCTKSQSLL